MTRLDKNNFPRFMLILLEKIYENIMIARLIWGFSYWRFTPKLINKQWYSSISKPSCCQKMKSRKNLFFSLSVILRRKFDKTLYDQKCKSRLMSLSPIYPVDTLSILCFLESYMVSLFTWTYISPRTVRVWAWKFVKSSWCFTVFFHCSLT